MAEAFERAPLERPPWLSERSSQQIRRKYRAGYIRFSGQIALVTGAASGMGLATARAFAQAGASVTLADVNADALHHAVDSLSVPAHRVLACLAT
ncbi:SDR family NAD(P)-dependent oxidoreductase [Paraburkholderia phosphatilytica]|uniref:SDR family NAD(P)-dependent oxidoreductase n=1 Tax=Paraburkholderia phosphatilytica TaxID=2282883 RepID=UPI0023E83E22|nr:SDR family NAD(P)-dependent oxidoreductase [Paraburkholderia phosphatilytica]